MGTSYERGAAPTALLYCHDTFGLGHLRRTLWLAAELSARWPDVAQLVATGSPFAHAFRLPKGADYLKLPSVVKTGRETYGARTLPLSIDEMVALRRELLETAVKWLRPRLVVVDNVPGGFGGELVPALRALRRDGSARLVLGLRDIVDEPSRVRRAWTRDRSYSLLDDVYDRILVYGDRDVFDPVGEYGFSRVAAEKTRFVGYLPRESAPTAAARSLWPGAEAARRVLVTVGGGEDGDHIVRAALAARANDPHYTSWLVVTGPFLGERERAHAEQLAAGLPATRVIEFVEDLPACVAAADVVVSMGGYNTICEILSARRPAVIVPRVEPRLEQLLRARALERLGIVSLIHPEELTPPLLGERVRSLLATSRVAKRSDFRVSESLVDELDEALALRLPQYALTGDS
jgi:predicted glycosyltransferase